MKIDINQPLTRNAQRVLNDFSDALFQLVREQAFEKITVNDLCELANYPRSTFYNYFEDKYDLLNHCWARLLEIIRIDGLGDVTEEQVLVAYFNREYDLLDANQEVVAKILQHNSSVGIRSSLSSYLLNGANRMFEGALVRRGNIPVELALEHCFSTILIVLDWVFIQGRDVSKEEAGEYLKELYGI